MNLDLNISIESELRRKTFEEMTRIMHRYETGKATLAQTQAAVMTLWNVTSGLIHDEDYDTFFAAMTGELNNVITRWGATQGVAEFTLMSGGGEAVLITRLPDSDIGNRFVVLKLVERDHTTKDVQPNEVVATRDRLINLFASRGMRLVSYC